METIIKTIVILFAILLAACAVLLVAWLFTGDLEIARTWGLATGGGLVGFSVVLKLWSKLILGAAGWSIQSLDSIDDANTDQGQDSVLAAGRFTRGACRAALHPRRGPGADRRGDPRGWFRRGVPVVSAFRTDAVVYLSDEQHDERNLNMERLNHPVKIY